MGKRRVEVQALINPRAYNEYKELISRVADWISRPQGSFPHLSGQAVQRSKSPSPSGARNKSIINQRSIGGVTR